MARIFVEGWAPEYGAPLDPDEALAPAEGSVDEAVETGTGPRSPASTTASTRIAFVDGVRRVDARLVLEDPVAGPVPGICGTFAVGAVSWDRTVPRSEIVAEQVERWAVLAGGRSEIFPVGARPALRHGHDPRPRSRRVDPRAAHGDAQRPRATSPPAWRPSASSSPTGR